MEYVSLDCGAPVGFASPSYSYSNTTTNPISPDSKENVGRRLVQDVRSIYEFYEESPYIQCPLGTNNIIKGCLSISEGLTMILTPWPTLQDELKGAVKIFRGFRDIIDGIGQLF